MKHLTALLTLGLGLSALSPVLAQTSYPMVMSVNPTAAQTGQSSVCTVEARYGFFGATEVIVSGEGVTGKIVTPMPEVKPGTKPPAMLRVDVEFTVTSEALPGVRDFRIVTPSGVSTLGQLVIVRDPVVKEEKNNNTFEQAQALTVPATLCGVIEKNEDVDFCKFPAKAGQTLVFHLRSMRLQDRIHDLQAHSDPILTLKNSNGSTLATADNTFFGDPCLSYTFTQDGDYYAEIRDVRYQGNQYWTWSLEIQDRPLVTQVHPLGVRAGETTSLELMGFHLPSGAVAPMTVPAGTPPGPSLQPLSVNGQAANPVPLVVTELPTVLEANQPNNTFAEAQAVPVPVGINGRIEAEGDLDCYVFEAKKGERFSFEIQARRQLSELDSNLKVLNEKGATLVENDDLRQFRRTHADSQVEFWAAPADGKYAVQVNDLHLRGGAGYVYFLQITRSEPYFELYLDTDKTQLSPGTHGVIFVNAVRKNGFDQEIQLEVEGLPAGVTAHCGRILLKPEHGCIVLTTDANTPLSTANLRITGKAIPKAETPDGQLLQTVAIPYQETYQPGGGRGHWPVIMHTVCVARPADVLKLEVSPLELSLKPGESKEIKVTLERDAGFKQNITLDLLYRHLNSVYGDTLPPGVTIDARASKTLLTGDKSEGLIVLTAAKDAKPVPRQQLSVMANLSLNFVMKKTFSSPPVYLTVEAP